MSDATGEERCGRCHYEDSNEHLFDGEETDDDDEDDDGAEGIALRDAASDSDEFSSDGEEQEM